jgi:hypothetical protein
MYLFTYTDLIEIIFFTASIYYFSLWLKQDRTKNLLVPFYCFCIITLLANTFHLQTISSFLFFYGPAILMLFVLMHQELLQRNFVSLHNIKPQNGSSTKNWIQTIIQIALRARTQNKTMRIVIEHTDSIGTSIIAPFRLETDIQGSLLTVLLDSSSFDQNNMIWLKSNGKLIAINSEWAYHSQKEWIADELKDTDAWLTDTLLFTSKIDALALLCSPERNGFTIIAQGKVIQEVSATQAIRIISHSLKIPMSKKGEKIYEIKRDQTKLNEQSHS